jgi:hypothetical protein
MIWGFMPYNLSDLQLIDDSNGLATFQYPDGQTMQVPSQGLSPQFMGQFNPMPTPTPVPHMQMTAQYEPTKVSLPDPVPTATPLPPPGMTTEQMFPKPALTPEVVAGLQGVDVPTKHSNERFSLTPSVQTMKPSQPSGSPSMGGLIDSGYKNRIEATKNMGMIDAAGQRKSSEMTEGAVQNAAQMNLNLQEQQTVFDGQVDQFMKAQQESQKLIKGMKVDPGRKFKSIGTWGKIGAAIAVMANALGNALQGRTGPNESLGVILKSIDDDIELQEKEIDKTKGDLNTDMNMLSRYMGLFGDRLQAKRMLRADYIDLVNMRLNALDKKIGSEKAKYAIQDGVGQLQIAQQKDRDDALNASVQRGAVAADAMRKAQEVKQDQKAPQKAIMMDAERSLQQLFNQGTTRPDRVPLLKGADERMFESAADQWVQNYMQATGQRLTKESIQMTKSSFMPSAYDSPAVVKDKQERRQKAMMSIGSAPSSGQEIQGEEEGF